MICLLIEEIDSKGFKRYFGKFTKVLILRFQSGLFLVNPVAGSLRSRRDSLPSLALRVLILESIGSI